MERFQWFRHRWQQVASTESKQGLSSANTSPTSKDDSDSQDHLGHRLSGKRRTVVARYGPHRAEYQSISKGYQGNNIRTTKYTLLSFIPMNLFQQFHRLSPSEHLSTENCRKYASPVSFPEAARVAFYLSVLLSAGPDGLDLLLHYSSEADLVTLVLWQQASGQSNLDYECHESKNKIYVA